MLLASLRIAERLLTSITMKTSRCRMGVSALVSAVILITYAIVQTQPKQSSLVNSIFTNFPIPPIVLAWVDEKDESDGSVERVLVCVDGKQVNTLVIRHATLIEDFP